MNENNELTTKQKLELAIKKARRQSRLAVKLGISRQFLNQIVKDLRPFPIDREDDLDLYLGIKKTEEVTS